jgi:hypothetical protein
LKLFQKEKNLIKIIMREYKILVHKDKIIKYYKNLQDLQTITIPKIKIQINNVKFLIVLLKKEYSPSS